MHRSRLLTCLSLVWLAPLATAQTITLSGEAGSFPGRIALELGPGPIGTQAAILISATKGPIPLGLIQPGDTRQLDVGLTGLFSFNGVILPPGKFSTPVIPVPNNPSFLDATLYAQGITLFENPPQIVARVSQPQPIRLAPAAKFRDRLTQFTTSRAFFPVIERADQSPMMVGGASGALLAQIATKKTEYYDAVTDSFVAGPDMTTERSLQTATKLNDGRYLIVAGVDVKNDPQATAEVYDPAKDTFTAVASMAIKRTGQTASLLPDGRVLVAGGLTFVSSKDLLGTIASIQATTEIYDAKTNTWTKGPDMNQPRAGHGTFTLSDGRVVLAGGLGYFKILGIPVPTIWKEVDIYDPKTNKVTSAAKMGTAHAIFSIAELGNDRFLIAGGAESISLSQPGKSTNEAEIYNGKTNQWSSSGKMARPRALLVAFDLGGGKYLHIGGADGDLQKPVALNTSEIYDVATNTWSAGPAMSADRAAFGYYITKYGQVHLLGGASTVIQQGQKVQQVVNTTDWYYR